VPAPTSAQPRAAANTHGFELALDLPYGEPDTGLDTWDLLPYLLATPSSLPDTP